MYSHLYCLQNNEYMATGRNSETLMELKENLLSYLSGDHSKSLIKYLSKFKVKTIAEMYDFEIHITKFKLEEKY